MTEHEPDMPVAFLTLVLVLSLMSIIFGPATFNH